MNFVPVLPEDRPRLDAVLRCVHRIAETIERDLTVSRTAGSSATTRTVPDCAGRAASSDFAGSLRADPPLATKPFAEIQGCCYLESLHLADSSI